MSEMKRVDRAVVIGAAVLCVVLLIGLVGAVITYNSMLDAKDSVIASKDLQIADKTSQISDMEAAVDEKQSEIDDLNSQIAQKNSTISDLNGQVSEKSSQISQKDSTISSLNNQIPALEAQKDALTSQVSSLNSQMDSLQTQKDGLTLEIAALNSEMVNLQLAYDNYVVAYQNLRDIINQRSTHISISDFITPQDPEVISIVYSITGGWSDQSDWGEFWTDLKALYTWTRTNIDYNYDGLSPVLPFNPADDPYYIAEMWQFPNETLELEKGDCEDQAILLCSMIRCYSDMGFAAECVLITSSTVGHVGVQLPVSGDKLVIFDPAGNYYSKDIFGNIAFNDISVEIYNWLNYWKSQGIGSDVYVYRVFSDYVDEAFSSTSEYLSWMYS